MLGPGAFLRHGEVVVADGAATVSHIWTVATLDGTEYHIDTTWGDSGRAISYNYFAMTEERSWAEHPW